MGDPRPWVVVGAGGHARSVIAALPTQAATGFTFIALTAELPSWSPPGSRALAESDFLPQSFAAARWLIAVGDNAARERLMGIVPRDASVPPIVASTATVAGDAVLGRGVVVLEHAHVGPGAVLGDGVIVNTGGVVEHDCRIGSFAHVCPHATVLGSSIVGERTLVGAGCVILPGLAVGADVTLGAGSVLVGDVGDGVTAVGLPARVIHSGGPSVGSS